MRLFARSLLLCVLVSACGTKERAKPAAGQDVAADPSKPKDNKNWVRKYW